MFDDGGLPLAWITFAIILVLFAFIEVITSIEYLADHLRWIE